MVFTLMKRTPKIIIIVSVPIFLSITSIAIWSYFESRFFSRRLVGLDKLDKELPEIESRFNATPEINDCGYLVEGFYLKKEYWKAIGYAEKCLTLEKSSGTIDWLLHFHLAELYYKVNDLKQSRQHLKSALELDRENRIIKYGYIEKSGLGKIYSQLSINNKSKQDKP